MDIDEKKQLVTTLKASILSQVLENLIMEALPLAKTPEQKEEVIQALLECRKRVLEIRAESFEAEDTPPLH